MSNLEERLRLLNEHCSPMAAAYSDRNGTDLCKLADYRFRREGGGRVLVGKPKWNLKAIEGMEEETFDRIIEFLIMQRRVLKSWEGVSFFDMMKKISGR
jgi:predicted urease superfamily metal-dependent hydrolase